MLKVTVIVTLWVLGEWRNWGFSENSPWHQACIEREIENPSQRILFKQLSQEVDFPDASHLWGLFTSWLFRRVFALLPCSFCRWNSRFSGNYSRTTPQTNDLPNNLLVPLMFGEWERRPRSYARENKGQDCNLCLTWQKGKNRMLLNTFSLY